MTQPLHLDYATRDYDGFVQLLVSVIDRQDTPWTERAAADVGIMVVELVAYELDRLAYAGDRVAEESFLPTARRRESARRHAALADYPLDRGNATRGFQWFQLAAGQQLALPARASVAAPDDPAHPDAARLFAETLEPVRLDARRNWFVLAHSVAAGARALRLAAADGSLPDLRALGLSAGMKLIVGKPPVPGLPPTPAEGPLQLAAGETVTVARVMRHGVELAQPLQSTWPGGPDGAWVLGNVVEVRRGTTSAWTQVGRGGAALGEIASDDFLRYRIDVVRRLRAEVEDARPAWIGRADLVARWTDACQAVTDVHALLQRIDPAAYNVGDPAQRAQLELLDAPLVAAAETFRQLLAAVGRDHPDELAASDRVAVPGQTLELDTGTEQPVLWMRPDGGPPARTETLAVAVGVAGGWTRWIEQPDLLRSQPDDPDYVVEIDGNDRVTLRFGDGVSGAALPASCQVMARWVTGDNRGDDIRGGALAASESAGAQPFPILATSNPLPTAGGAAPEPLDGVAARVAQNLAVPAVPVTRRDYQDLLGELGGIAESVVAVAHGAIDIVIRPAAGVAAAQLLDRVRAWLDANRLAGTTVTVRLARELAIDIAVVVDVHPDVSADDLFYRVQRALVAAFDDSDPEAERLGVPRERAEVYRVVEEVPGVLWSQIVGFDLTGNPPPGVLDAIAPAADQVVRCAGIEEQPAAGQITVWAARRFSLQVTVSYDSLDARPDFAAIQRLLPVLLSGPASLPAQRGWTALTAAIVEHALATALAGSGVTAEVTRLIAERRAVAEIELGPRELPILDSAIVVDGGVRASR
ncbi:MAG TPA: baseplate J/gp47 family protein [Kofleriaceae bacterium]|jgi:hypothetical protein|nr:baseplate J/gp47 family protein [Kofleriaceae bacterium]